MKQYHAWQWRRGEEERRRVVREYSERVAARLKEAFQHPVSHAPGEPYWWPEIHPKERKRYE